MNIHRYSTLIFTLFLLVSCDEDTPKIVINSVSPSTGVAGDTISVSVSGHGVDSNARVLIGSQQGRIIDVQNSVIRVTIPKLKAGAQDVEVQQGDVKTIITNGFEYLPLQLENFDNPVVRTYFYDTLILYGKNIPLLGLTEFTLWYDNSDGTKQLASQLLEVIDVNRNSLVIRSLQGPKNNYTFYLRLMSSYYVLPDIEYGHHFRIVGNKSVTPHQQITLLNRLPSFDLNIFIEGEELETIYGMPIDFFEGYTRLSGFRTPVLPPGEYTITAIDPSGSPVFSDGGERITIHDMEFCSSSSTYSKAEEIRINLFGGKINPYECYNCPASVTLVNELGQEEYGCTIVTKHFVEHVSENESYMTVSTPADIPQNQFYTIEIATEHGYKYKSRDDCAEVVFIE